VVFESFNPWLAWPGITIGVVLIVGSLESVGSFDEKGWKVAGAMIPIAYTAWSLGSAESHPSGPGIAAITLAG
jgi:hypothetical protein